MIDSNPILLKLICLTNLSSDNRGMRTGDATSIRYVVNIYVC